MNEITAPLRLATGSHDAGSGKGCAMNVISWENGDSVITDYPACSARPLARLVQSVNDRICSHAKGGFLCPECSSVVLRLGHATVGTAGATREQEIAWLAELLDSQWGLTAVIPDCPAIVREVAELLRRESSSDKPTYAEWNADYIDYIDYAASHATTYAASAAASAYADYIDYIDYAASHASHASHAAHAASHAASHAAYVAASHAANAAADASASAAYAASSARVAHCEAAIAAWHRICGTSPAATSPEVTREAVSKMLVSASGEH